MTLVIGHKGAHGTVRENSIAAFALARRLGVDGVELDVRRAHGGRLAVWHDPVSGDGRPLLDTPWPELDGEMDDLDGVLSACVGLGLVNVEIKNWPADEDFDASLGIADAVAELLATRSPDERRAFVVSCFHADTVARARARLDDVAPEVRTGLLLWMTGDVEPLVEGAVAAGHQALHPHHLAVTPELVEQAHAAGLVVNCWTCNEAERMRWLADIGVDGVITDDVDLGLQVLRDGAKRVRP